MSNNLDEIFDDFKDRITEMFNDIHKKIEEINNILRTDLEVMKVLNQEQKLLFTIKDKIKNNRDEPDKCYSDDDENAEHILSWIISKVEDDWNEKCDDCDFKGKDEFYTDYCHIADMVRCPRVIDKVSEYNGEI